MCVGTSSAPLIFCRWKMYLSFYSFYPGYEMFTLTTDQSAVCVAVRRSRLLFVLLYLLKFMLIESRKPNKWNPRKGILHAGCVFSWIYDLLERRWAASSAPFLSWGLFGKRCSKDGKLLDKVQPSPLISMFEKQSIIWYLRCTEAGLGVAVLVDHKYGFDMVWY